MSTIIICHPSFFVIVFITWLCVRLIWEGGYFVVEVVVDSTIMLCHLL